jgi:F-type H+/Na+-transporting ATPase subunit alpha
MSRLARVVGAIVPSLGPSRGRHRAGRRARAPRGCRGCRACSAEELVEFRGGVLGQAFNLDEDEVGVILLGDSRSLAAGDEARRTGRVTDVPVGHALIGRVIDPTGRPRDRRGPLQAPLRWPIEREAHAIMDRAPVSVPLEDGPQGGGRARAHRARPARADPGRPPDRQVGHRARHDPPPARAGRHLRVLRDRPAQRGRGALPRRAEAARRARLQRRGVASGEESPGLQFIAPYAATSIAEFFMEEGRDVLIVYDDLTRHAQAYRELSLLLRRPAGARGVPGRHLLHPRAAAGARHPPAARVRRRLDDGPADHRDRGAEPVGLHPDEPHLDHGRPDLPVARTCSRRGCCRPCTWGCRSRASAARRSCRRIAPWRGPAPVLQQFEELEAFARFGTRLDEDTRRTLARGERVREVLKQPQYATLPAAEQVVTLLAVTAGFFDPFRSTARRTPRRPSARPCTPSSRDLWAAIARGEALTDAQREALIATAHAASRQRSKQGPMQTPEAIKRQLETARTSAPSFAR